MISSDLPSLETLINQCCEDYYFKLSIPSDELQKHLDSLEIKLDPNSNSNLNEKYFNFKIFEQFIISAHCCENLHFLIEIYHYEKIWNRVFKRQSSILKCKDESIANLRKLSVNTILSNKSPSKHKSSIMEQPEENDKHEEHDEHEEHNNLIPEPSQTNDPANQQNSAPLYHLSLPSVITSGNEFDTKSFVNLDAQIPHKTNKLKNTEIWESLFSPSFCSDQHDLCSCKDEENHHHDLKSIYENDNHEESIKILELREKSKDELTEKFSFIIKQFVLNNSPYEVNLPGDVYSNLISEYENTKILFHSPLTLLPAKNAVLQLLRENIYYSFISKQQKLASKDLDINQPYPKKQHDNDNNKSSVPTPSGLIHPKPSRLPPHNLDDNSSDVESTNSQDSSNRPTPVQSISNFLNKYHLKISSADSYSNSSIESNSPIISRISTPKGIHNFQRDRSSTQPTSSLPKLNYSPSSLENESGFLNDSSIPEGEPIGRSISLSNKRLGSNYIKGPCGIEPNMTAYNPKPPILEKKSKWSSKFLKFKQKIKNYTDE